MAASDWMDEARGDAARCWCDEETKDRIMDPSLAEAFARRLAAWMDSAVQNHRNAEYYRGLVVECGTAIGVAAFTADDGGIHDSVLCAKVPELVRRLVRMDV